MAGQDQDENRDEDRDKNPGLDRKAEEYSWKAKEAIGNATGDENLSRQGRNDQARSNLKQAADKIKRAFRRK